MKFHPFAELFPMMDGAEWLAFCSGIKDTEGIKDNPILYRVVDGEKQGLDGRQRLRACEKLNIAPTFKEVEVADADVEKFITNCNLHRRHMTPAGRKSTVAKMRALGKSVRDIAEATGAPKSTVADDVKSGVRIRTPDEEPAKTTGKDGKSYPAKAAKPVTLCRRCQVAGPAKNCPYCAEERKGAKSGREPGDRNPKRPSRKSGKELFDWKAFNSDFGGCVRQVDKLGNAFGCKESNEAKKLRNLLSEFLSGFKSLYESKSGAKAPK